MGIFSCSVQAQNFVYLTNQADMDSFALNSASDTLAWLSIALASENTSDPIVKIPDIPLDLISYLRITINENTPSNIDIEGLNAIGQVDSLQFDLYQNLDFSDITSIDTLKYLRIIGLNDVSVDMSHYTSVKHIREELRIHRTRNNEALRYTVDSGFYLNVYNHPLSMDREIWDIAEILPDNHEAIRSLSITGDVDSLTYDGLVDIDTLDYLYLEYSTFDRGYNGINTIDYVENLCIVDRQRDFDSTYANKILHDSFSTLTLNFIQHDSLRWLLPNLTYVADGLQLWLTDLKSIDILKEMPRMSLLTSDEFRSRSNLWLSHLDLGIYMVDNPNLDLCAYDFICDAVKNYPDRTFIEGNEDGCNPDGITAACGAVSTSEVSKDHRLPYPNPIVDRISLPGCASCRVSITSIDRIYHSTTIAKDQSIDMQEPPSGMYVLRYQGQVERVVKW